MSIAIVVSAPGTGAGKTLVARALCIAFERRVMRVQLYKIGPDYIDARLYRSIVGRPAFNVDQWLDGRDADDAGATSTAAVAQLVGASVVLVLDGWTASQTVAASARGMQAYAPGLDIAGVVLNRCGGPAHEAAMRAA